MEESHGNTSDQVLIALRQIIRAIDLHSRQLQRQHGLTSPQILILKEVVRHEGVTAQEIGKRVHLSRATVADILMRLEKRKLITRARNTRDRRLVNITATEHAIGMLADSPPLLHESFIQKFNELRPWEQTQFLSVFQRTADMMNAEHLDVAPFLAADPIIESPTPMLEPETSEKKDVAPEEPEPVVKLISNGGK